jgi:hypothetical protein
MGRSLGPRGKVVAIVHKIPAMCQVHYIPCGPSHDPPLRIISPLYTEEMEAS